MKYVWLGDDNVVSVRLDAIDSWYCGGLDADGYNLHMGVNGAKVTIVYSTNEARDKDLEALDNLLDPRSLEWAEEMTIRDTNVTG